MAPNKTSILKISMYALLLLCSISCVNKINDDCGKEDTESILIAMLLHQGHRACAHRHHHRAGLSLEKQLNTYIQQI